MDAVVAGERPSKSVVFQFGDEGGRSSSAGSDMVGVSDAGKLLPSSSRPDDTDYSTSELGSIARRRIDDVSGRRIHQAAALGLTCFSGITVQHVLGAGRSNSYPRDSARTLLKECFADNPPIQLDTHHQLTEMSSDQMIQFARAVGLEVLLATFGLLEDVLFKVGGKTGRSVDDKGSGEGPSFIRGVSKVIESVESRSFYSLPTTTESFDSDPSAGDLSQQRCSSRQAGAAFGFSQTQVTDINETDSLKTREQICSDARKKSNLYKWSREVRRDPISPSESDDGGMCSLRRCWRLPPLRRYLLQDLKIF